MDETPPPKRSIIFFCGYLEVRFETCECIFLRCHPEPWRRIPALSNSPARLPAFQPAIDSSLMLALAGTAHFRAFPSRFRYSRQVFRRSRMCMNLASLRTKISPAFASSLRWCESVAAVIGSWQRISVAGQLLSARNPRKNVIASRVCQRLRNFLECSRSMFLDTGLFEFEATRFAAHVLPHFPPSCSPSVLPIWERNWHKRNFLAARASIIYASNL